MDSYSKLKQINLSAFFSEETVPISIQAKGLLISNPTVAARSIVAFVEVPGGGSTISVTIPVAARSSKIINHKITGVNGSAIDASLNIFELY